MSDSHTTTISHGLPACCPVRTIGALAVEPDGHNVDLDRDADLVGDGEALEARHVACKREEREQGGVCASCRTVCVRGEGQMALSGLGEEGLEAAAERRPRTCVHEALQAVWADHLLVERVVPLPHEALCASGRGEESDRAAAETEWRRRAPCNAR